MNDRELYLAALPGWAALYVAGHWTLGEFEAHADRMREALFGPFQNRRPPVKVAPDASTSRDRRGRV